jgi:hypothetical protein
LNRLLQATRTRLRPDLPAHAGLRSALRSVAGAHGARAPDDGLARYAVGAPEVGQPAASRVC